LLHNNYLTKFILIYKTKNKELLTNDQTTILEQWTNRDSFLRLEGHKKNTPTKNEIDLKLTLGKMSKK